jgi:GAF domain-containing protein
MALPLIVGGQVIGALDVQSERTNAFSDQDIEIFSTLADQIAIAITNSRLYQETSQALEESQILHRQYLHEEWAKFGEEETNSGYLFTEKGVIPQPIEEIPHPESKPMDREISSIVTVENGQTMTTLRVPITLRGETIGIIHLRDSDPQKQDWSESEIETARAVADQVSQALENARLFEQTVQRAERERLVLDITNKIRAASDPEKMMQIAQEELQRALKASKVDFILADSPINTSSNHENNGFHR